jgi:hypothetical protein
MPEDTTGALPLVEDVSTLEKGALVHGYVAKTESAGCFVWLNRCGERGIGMREEWARVLLCCVWGRGVAV